MPKVTVQFSRPPLERMMKIHQLLRDGRFPNCSSLSGEIEVSKRTISRDIDFMKERLGLPIDYDNQRYGYFYSREVDNFPPVPASEEEIFSLLVARKAIQQYRGTPFERPLEAAFRKLSGQLDTTASCHYADLEPAFSIHPFAPEDSDLENFEIINRAINQRRTLKFRYRNLGASRSLLRQVCPYHVACIDSRWYLFAHDRKRRAMRTFVLQRMEKPELLKEQFVKPADFDPHEYLSGSIGVFTGNQDFEIILQFDRWAADLLRGRKWHSSQHWTDLPGGGVRLRMRLNNIEEIQRWILSWGDHARVIGPKTLAKRIRAIATRMTLAD